MVEVERHFRPEFLNRVDELIVFNPLTIEDLRHIVKLQLAEVLQRLSEKGIELDLTQKSIDFLIDKGFHEDYGARPLRRAIERHVEDPLAEELLRSCGRKFKIQVDLHENGEEMVFETLEMEEEPEPVEANAGDTE